MRLIRALLGDAVARAAGRPSAIADEPRQKLMAARLPPYLLEVPVGAFIGPLRA